MASKYDIRRTSNAQGIPAMQKANTRGFDPKQFEPPTGEEDRDKDNEREEEDDGLFSRLFDGLLSTIGSPLGGTPTPRETFVTDGEFNPNPTPEERQAMNQQYRDQRIAESRIHAEGLNPIGRGYYGGINDELIAGGFDPMQIPDVPSENIVTRNLPATFNVGSKMGGEVPLRKYGENTIDGFNWLAERVPEEVTNLPNWAIAAGGTALKGSLAGLGYATNKLGFKGASIPRAAIKAFTGTTGALVEPMLTQGTFASKLTKEIAMINLMQASAGSTDLYLESQGVESGVLRSLSGLATALVTGTVTSAHLDSVLRQLDPSVRDNVALAVDKISQQRRLEVARLQMEESNGVPANVDLGATVRPNLPDTPRLTDPDFDPDSIPPYRTTGEDVIKLDKDGTIRIEEPNDIRAAEKEIIARESGAPTSVPAEVPANRLVDSKGSGAEFRNSIKSVKEESPFGWAVDVKDEEFYSNPDNLIFFDETGTAGAAVTIDGDLVSVHKQAGSNADVNEILRQASENAATLDAFDIDGFLPNLYATQGFKPVARAKFNRDYAPEGWRPEDGEHDIVLMVRDTENVLDDVQAIPQGNLPDGRVTADYDSIRDSVPFFEDFDEAVGMQQLARARVLEQVPLPERPVPQMTKEESPLPVKELDADEFGSVMAPQGLQIGTGLVDNLNRNFNDLYRQAQIEANLASKGWIPSAVDNQISAFNQGKYITADGRQMDWFDVPALPYGNQNKWLLETEYQTLQHQMDGHLTAQFSRIDGISLENTIPFGTHPVTRKPNMRSLNSFMENGRWKQEAIYDEYTNPEGFIDLDFKTGNYIFKGDAGAAVLDIFAKYGVVIEAQEALEMSLGIGLSRIDRRMAETAENGNDPELIAEIAAAWRRNELPWLGDTIEGSGAFNGLFPRSVVKGFENVSSRGTTGRTLGFAESGEGVYRESMAQVALGMREAGDNLEYLGNPAMLVGIRLQAGMNAILKDWVRRYVTSPRAGLGGETVLERARLSPKFRELEIKLKEDRDAVGNALKVLKEIETKALPRATRESRAAEQAAAALGGQTARLDVLNQALRNQYISRGQDLLPQVRSFAQNFLQVGRPLVKGARGTKLQPIMRIPPKTAQKLSEQIKLVDNMLVDAEVPPAELREAIDELQFLYDRGLTIFGNELKKRPNLARQIDELKTEPNAEKTEDAWTNRQILNDTRKMQSTEDEIRVIEDKIIPALEARKNRADPARFDELNEALDSVRVVLDSAKKRVQAGREIYEQQIVRMSGVNQDILKRQEIVFDSDGRPMRQPPRMGPDGTLVEGELITRSVPYLQTDSSKVLTQFAQTGHVVDKEFGEAVEALLDTEAKNHGWGKVGSEWDNANNAIRSLQASYDLSGIGIQGMAAFGLSPTDMIMAQARSLMFVLNPKYKVRWYEANRPRIEEFISEYNLHYGSTSSMGEFLIPDRVLGLSIAGDVPTPFRTKKDPTTGRPVSGRTVTNPFNGKSIHLSSPADWEKNYDGMAQQVLNTLGYIPAKVASKGLNISNAAFAEGGNMMRHQLLESLLSTKSVADAYGTKINFSSLRGLPYKGILPDGPLTPQTKQELGEMINNLTGWKKGRPSVGARALLFAPKFFGAQIKSLEKAASENSPAGKLARRALTNLVVTMGLFTWWSNKQMGHDTNFNPVDVFASETEDGKVVKNPDFMALKVGDRKYKMLGTYDSLMGLGITGASALDEGDPFEAGNRILSSKSAPLVDKAMVIINRETYNGQTFNFDGLMDVRTAMAMASHLAFESNLPFGIQGEIESQRALNNGEVDITKIINWHLLFGALGGKESPLSPNDRVLIRARQLNPDADYQNFGEIPKQLKFDIQRENPYLYARQEELDQQQYDASARVGGARRKDIINAKADLWREEQVLAANVISGQIPRSRIPQELAKLSYAYAYAMQGIQERTLTKELDIKHLTAPLRVVRRISETWDAAALPNGMVDHSLRLKLLSDIEAEFGSEIYNHAESIMRGVIDEHPEDVREILRAKDYITRETEYYGTTDRVFEAFFYDLDALASVIGGTAAGSNTTHTNRENANTMHKLVEEISGNRRINSYHEFQVVTRTSDTLLSNIVLSKINGAIQTMVEESKKSQKRNDQKLDESAIVYMGSKPVMTLEAQQEHPSGWPQAFTTVDMANEIRRISFHPESAEKYIQLLTMTQVLNEQGMQPDAIASGISDDINMFRPPERQDIQYQAR